MHLNYFALRHFSRALHQLLHQGTFIHAFSLSKEELVFCFLDKNDKEFFLVVNLVNRNCYLKVMENYNRPKRNFLYQFEEANGGHVEGIIQNTFDRSFYVQLKNGFSLLFKLHGSFSNVLMLNSEGVCESQFRKELANDNHITLASLQKNQDLSLLYTQDFPDYEAIKKVQPLFDSYCIAFLARKQFLTLNEAAKKQLIAQYFEGNDVRFYLLQNDTSYHLEIFPDDQAEYFEDALKAYTTLANKVLPKYHEQQLRTQLLQQLQSKLAKLQKQKQSNDRHLANAQSYLHYEQTGHIIMANLYVLSPKMTEASLFDFYANEQRVIKLDKTLNPQENAEKYYKKAKAHKQELPALEKQQAQINEAINQQEILIAQLGELEGIKALRAFATSNELLKINEEENLFPFRKCEVEGYEIWIGKNAANNDLLTFDYAHKNDLWFHARDVSGSHVIIRNQTGKSIPSTVIEKTAGLAAYFSKSKNQHLATVQYTIKKFVMKSKGSHPGAVHLLNEQTILVAPRAPENLN